MNRPKNQKKDARKPWKKTNEMDLTFDRKRIINLHLMKKKNEIHQK